MGAGEKSAQRICRLSTAAGKPFSYFVQWAEDKQHSNDLRIGTEKSLRAKANWFLESCRHMEAGTARPRKRAESKSNIT